MLMKGRVKYSHPHLEASFRGMMSFDTEVIISIIDTNSKNNLVILGNDAKKIAAEINSAAV